MPPHAPFDAERAYDEAPCGLLITDGEGLILHANGTFCRWVGRDCGELVGKVRLQSLLTMGGRIFHQTHWAPLLQIQGSISEVKLELLHRDGRKVPTVWNAVLRNLDGIVRQEVAVFIAEDRHKYEHELVLARRRAEELLAREQAIQADLREAQLERDRQKALAEDRALFAEQMVAIVSHDLRTPLSVTRMSAQILARSGLAPEQEPVVARMVRSNERALRLIADLLDFSRSRLGSGLHMDMAAVDWHLLVRDVLEELRVANSDATVEHRQLGTGSCEGDPDRLNQLVGNLVLNAVTYGAPETPVVVTSSIEVGRFAVSVNNRGTPIAPEALAGIFDPMTRGTPGAGDSSSVGLGLFIVRQIAEAHGGQVTVESDAEHGTTFTATFPRSPGVPR